MKINKLTENYIVDMLKSKMQHKDREMVWMVLVNSEGLPFSFKCIVKGTEKDCDFNMAELEKHIIMHDPKAIYISHNHPGNTMITTSFDDDFTRKTIRLCKRRNVELIDHIIIMRSRDEHYSYKEKSKLAAEIEKTKPSKKPETVFKVNKVAKK